MPVAPPNLGPRRNLRCSPRVPAARADIGDELAEASERVERQALLLRRWGFHCHCELCVAQAGEDESSLAHEATRGAHDSDPCTGPAGSGGKSERKARGSRNKVR